MLLPLTWFLKKVNNMSEIYPEGSAVDVLKQFAKDTGREIYAKEEPFDLGVTSRITYHVRKVYIPVDDKHELFYISYGNSRDFMHDKYANFSGVFFPINLPNTTVLKIRNRDILDKINPFLKESDFKSNNKDFDSKVVIEENDIFSAKSLLNREKIQKITSQILDHNQLLNIGVNNLKIDFVDEINGKSHLGIYLLNDWIIKPEEIEFLFEKVRRIKAALIF